MAPCLRGWPHRSIPSAAIRTPEASRANMLAPLRVFSGFANVLAHGTTQYRNRRQASPQVSFRQELLRGNSRLTAANLYPRIRLRSATICSSAASATWRGPEDDRAGPRPALLKPGAGAGDRDIPAATSREKPPDCRYRLKKQKTEASLRGCASHTNSAGGRDTCEGGLSYQESFA